MAPPTRTSRGCSSTPANAPRQCGSPFPVHACSRLTVRARGKQTKSQLWCSTYSVHPRVGGGNEDTDVAPLPGWGPSPRGRGKLTPRTERRAERGSIPAWAGETRRPVRGRAATEVHPRVGGGNFCAHTNPDASGGPSPRGRGKPRSTNSSSPDSGSIPAWAGET